MITSRKHLRLIGALSDGAGWYISPNGYDLYRSQPGDSFASLAATYLGSAGRSDEIYMLQSPDWRSRFTESSLPSGEALYMPQEAINQAFDLGFITGDGKGAAPGKESVAKQLESGEDVLVTPTPSVPRPSPAPAPKPSPSPSPTPPPPAATSSSKVPLIIGGALAAAAAVTGILIVHKKHAKRSNPRRGRRARVSFRHHHDGA